MEEMARTGQWQRLLSVANRRAEQLPLRPDEAYLAAHAARLVGDRTAEIAHLTRAMDGGPFAELARLQLAMAVVGDDPQRAADLALPFLRSAPTSVMRDESVSVVIESLENGLDPETSSVAGGGFKESPNLLAATTGAWPGGHRE